MKERQAMPWWMEGAYIVLRWIDKRRQRSDLCRDVNSLKKEIALLKEEVRILRRHVGL